MRPAQPGRYRDALQPKDHGDPPTPHFEPMPYKRTSGRHKPDELSHYPRGAKRLNKRRG